MIFLSVEAEKPPTAWGTADSEYWNRLGVRSVLLEIPEASVNKGPEFDFTD